jgi:hypothetical protein
MWSLEEFQASEILNFIIFDTLCSYSFLLKNIYIVPCIYPILEV